MLRFNFEAKHGVPDRVLCLGSHSDDIEIGCGGTILRLMADHPGIEFYWVVFGSDEERAREASESANMFLLPVKKKTIVVKNFRDGFFPYIGPGIKKFFEQLKQQFFPDLIFTHYRDDLHQDHRLISDLTWNTFREHLILEYEIPKYDGDFGSPNFFVHLDKSLCQKKTEYILTCFKSQRGRHWFTHDTFLSVLRLRGMESCSPTNYAEGFYCRKAVL